MVPPRLPPAVLGSLILLLVASVMGLILAGRPNPALLNHPDIEIISAQAGIAPSWKTVVLFSSGETEAPAAAVSAKLQAIQEWPTWARSGLRVSEQINNFDTGMIRFRIEALYGLFPIDYTAPIRETAPDRLLWGRVQPGAATLFAWRLTPAEAGRTRVSLTVYLDGPAYGGLRALLEPEGQAEVDRIVTHLLTALR